MSTAAAQIRESVAALPEEHRGVWRQGGDAGCAVYTDTGDRDNDEWIVSGDTPLYGGRAAAAHIAMLASPHVATALADLLDEFKRHDTAGPPCHPTDECWDVVADKIDALEAALSRQPRTRSDTVSTEPVPSLRQKDEAQLREQVDRLVAENDRLRRQRDEAMRIGRYRTPTPPDPLPPPAQPTTEAQKGVRSIQTIAENIQAETYCTSTVFCPVPGVLYGEVQEVQRLLAQIKDLRSAHAAVLSALGLPDGADPVEAIRHVKSRYEAMYRRDIGIATVLLTACGIDPQTHEPVPDSIDLARRIVAERDAATEAARLAEQARHGALVAGATTVELIQRELDEAKAEVKRLRTDLLIDDEAREHLAALRAEVQRIAADFAAQDAKFGPSGIFIYGHLARRLRAALASSPTAQPPAEPFTSWSSGALRRARDIGDVTRETHVWVGFGREVRERIDRGTQHLIAAHTPESARAKANALLAAADEAARRPESPPTTQTDGGTP